MLQQLLLSCGCGLVHDDAWQVGRGSQRALRPEVRSDHIFWLDGAGGQQGAQQGAQQGEGGGGGTGDDGSGTGRTAVEGGGEERGGAALVSAAVQEYWQVVDELRRLMNR